MSEAVMLLNSALAPFWDDMAAPDFEDLLFQKPGEIWIRRGGTMFRRDVPEFDAAEAEAILRLAGAGKGQNLGGAHKPLLSCDMPGGYRVQGVIEPCVPAGTVAGAIRRSKSVAPTVREIAGGGVFDAVGASVSTRHTETDRLMGLYRAAREAPINMRGDAWTEFFAGTVAARYTHVICGMVGTGKTHLSMGLANFIPLDMRLATIQDADEWAGLPHPNRVSLFHSKGEQSGVPTTATDLVEACLRLAMDWLLMQEVRGAEAFSLMRALRSGHPGITTCHASSAEGVFSTLAMMTAMDPRAASMSPAILESAWRALVPVVIHTTRESGAFRVADVLFRPDAGKDATNLAELDHALGA